MSTPKEVCPTCKGTGTFRWTHRLTGAKSGTCATCMGSGKNSPVAAAAILNDLSPGTAEQIATRMAECFEAGQRRSDGSMALHPNRERWYIADAYRLARIVLGDSGRRGWVCIRHRCAAHYDVPAQNTNEASGSECGGCIAEERDKARSALAEQMKNTLAHQRRADVALDWHRLAVKQRDALQVRLDEAQNVARMNGAERDRLQAEVENLRRNEDLYLAENTALHAKLARLVEAVRAFVGINDCVCGDESACCYHGDKDELGRVVVALRALLADEPETPRGDPTYFSGVPGCNPPSHAHNCTCKPDKLALAMAVVVAAVEYRESVRGSGVNPDEADAVLGDALDALARFEASDAE